MKAIFNTKFTKDYDRNGQEVEIIKITKGRSSFEDRYKIKFSDGYIIKNAYNTELRFI